MQKLVFTNGGGQTIDLTSGNFGITNWEGLSGVGLNIQTQQVPFQDGGVFLDALIEQREISVTVAIQDNNDLSARYELKRQLISALNPKLGEGVLVYTNDYLSRQIRAVPQLPIFENKNSNDAGTLKANVTFSCPSPYWEDLEEIVVNLQTGVVKTIENQGDIPCGVEIKINTNSIGYPVIKNLNNNKKILLEGLFGSNLRINTNTGEKQVIGETNGLVAQLVKNAFYKVVYNEYVKKYFITNFFSARSFTGYSEDGNKVYIYAEEDYGVTDFAYSETLGYFVKIGTQTASKSLDGVHWEKICDDANLDYTFSIARSEELGIFVAGRETDVYTSPDGYNWTRLVIDSSITGIYNIQWIPSLQKFYFIQSQTDAVWTYDGTDWVSLPTLTGSVMRIKYAEELGLYFTNTNVSQLYKSSDGITWTQVTISNLIEISAFEWTGSELYVFGVSAGNYIPQIYTSTDGTNFAFKCNMLYRLYDILYHNNKFIACGNNGAIATSEDGTTWDFQKYLVSANANDLFCFTYCTGNNKTYAVFRESLMTTQDGENWTVETPNVNIQIMAWIKEKNLFVGFDGSAIISSTDGINWTSRKTVSNAGNFVYSKKLDKIVSVYTTYNSGTGQSTVHSLTSSNGTSWTETNGISFAGELQAGLQIAYSETLGKFVAGSENHWFTSTNGTTWTHYTNANIYINSLFRVERDGYFYSFYEKMYKSQDGVTWTAVTIASDVYPTSGAYSEELGMYFAIGTNYNHPENIYAGWFISLDGQNWERYDYFGEGSYAQRTIYSPYAGKFITGNGLEVACLMGTMEEENFINTMSIDSDIGLNLEVGENKLICSRTNGQGQFSITYRQKYIGV